MKIYNSYKTRHCCRFCFWEFDADQILRVQVNEGFHSNFDPDYQFMTFDLQDKWVYSIAHLDFDLVFLGRRSGFFLFINRTKSQNICKMNLCYYACKLNSVSISFVHEQNTIDQS